MLVQVGRAYVPQAHNTVFPFVPSILQCSAVIVTNAGLNDGWGGGKTAKLSVISISMAIK